VFVRILPKRTLQNALTAAGLLAATVLMLWRPQAMATGISRGLSVCSSVIIPTLYPFMLLAGLLADSPLCRRPGRLTAALTRRMFGLPGCCGPAILLSLVGGYPAGVLAVSRLRQQGQLNREQVSRMTAYCVGGGPGFIISTVGAGLLGSTRAGILLFAAHATASLVIGIWLGRGHRHDRCCTPASAAAPARPMAQIVGDTCGSLLTMCGFVVLAATVLSLCEALALPRLLAHLSGLPAAGWSASLAALLEVSCGCIALAGTGELAPLWLSLCMSWSGLSVQGQLAAALKDQRVLGLRFWGWRLIHGLLSGGLSMALFRLIPADLPTGHIGGGLSTLPYSVSAAASLMLLLLSFLAMLCFSPKKTGKTE